MKELLMLAVYLVTFAFSASSIAQDETKNEDVGELKQHIAQLTHELNKAMVIKERLLKDNRELSKQISEKNESRPLSKAEQDAFKADEDAIRQTALDYGEGWYEADADRMKRALHPDVAKRIVIKDKLRQMNASDLIKATESGGGKQTPARKIGIEFEIMAIFENVACVRLMMTNGRLDLIHMYKTDGQWKIINVTSI